MTAPALRVVAVELYERPVVLRMPFRFGVVTLTEAPQVFVRARVALEDGREGWGAAAELLAPKWFDKNLALTNEQNFDQLRLALRHAADAYTGDATPRSAFAHYAAHYHALLAAGARRGLNALVASYGPAQLDRAIADALCRLLGVSIYDAVRANLLGIGVGLTTDLAGFDIGRFLAGMTPTTSIAARHTVGLVDAIAGHPHQVNDGLPESLEEVVAAYGHTWFKLKVGGDVEADIARLKEIAAVLDASRAPYRASLDGNEQYDDLDALLALWRRMQEEPALSRLVDSIAFLEQPINRKHALDREIGALSAVKPVIIDESDADLDAFPTARRLGYSGVSSKCCKGFYKSLLNLARCAHWNSGALARSAARYFMTGEDLTTQAGLAVQQDLALVSLLGMTHVERNGHHYANGMAVAPRAEQDAFLAAHPDLYHRADGVVRLAIRGGEIAIGSLACAGFASGAAPDFSAMQPSPVPTFEGAPLA
jgi:hypothetical protein